MSACSRITTEASLENQLTSIATDVDFSFYVEDSLGESFSFNRGTSTLNTPYESASTSKWVSAAVILNLVDEGVLNLTDKPQDYLSAAEWTIDSLDPLYNMDLSQLLSFTSGLTEDALCSNAPGFDYFECVANISNNNQDNGNTPGEAFSYGSNHLQVAGAMAIKAGGFTNWNELFTSFKADTNLFPASSFNLPSTTNPRLAGGMTWTATDYINFLRAYKNADFYSSSAIVDNATSDKISNATIAYSPTTLGLMEDWHYGYGLWIECHSETFDCTATTQVSSPGAYGAYPFVNLENDYFGIIARQGNLGTFTEGYAIYDSIRENVESWALCENP